MEFLQLIMLFAWWESYSTLNQFCLISRHVSSNNNAWDSITLAIYSCNAQVPESRQACNVPNLYRRILVIQYDLPLLADLVVAFQNFPERPLDDRADNPFIPMFIKDSIFVNATHSTYPR